MTWEVDLVSVSFHPPTPFLSLLATPHNSKKWSKKESKHDSYVKQVSKKLRNHKKQREEQSSAGQTVCGQVKSEEKGWVKIKRAGYCFQSGILCRKSFFTAWLLCRSLNQRVFHGGIAIPPSSLKAAVSQHWMAFPLCICCTHDFCLATKTAFSSSTLSERKGNPKLLNIYKCYPSVPAFDCCAGLDWWHTKHHSYRISSFMFNIKRRWLWVRNSEKCRDGTMWIHFSKTHKSAERQRKVFLLSIMTTVKYTATLYLCSWVCVRVSLSTHNAQNYA